MRLGGRRNEGPCAKATTKKGMGSAMSLFPSGKEGKKSGIGNQVCFLIEYGQRKEKERVIHVFGSGGKKQSPGSPPCGLWEEALMAHRKERGRASVNSSSPGETNNYFHLVPKGDC